VTGGKKQKGPYQAKKAMPKILIENIELGERKEIFPSQPIMVSGERRHLSLGEIPEKSWPKMVLVH